MSSEGSFQKDVVVDSTVSAVEDMCRKLLTEAEANGFGSDDIFAIHLAIEEALTNAVRHGNQQNPDKKINIKYSVTAEKFEISVSDSGNGFTPDSLPDPRCGENLYKCGGRGVLLMRAYMDVVEYSEIGNSVHMIKYKGKVKDKT